MCKVISTQATVKNHKNSVMLVLSGLVHLLVGFLWVRGVGKCVGEGSLHDSEKEQNWSGQAVLP